MFINIRSFWQGGKIGQTFQPNEVSNTSTAVLDDGGRGIRSSRSGLGIQLRWWNACPTCSKLWVLTPALHKPRVVAHTSKFQHSGGRGRRIRGSGSFSPAERVQNQSVCVQNHMCVHTYNLCVWTPNTNVSNLAEQLFSIIHIQMKIIKIYILSDACL